VISAAGRLFAEHGYARTTLNKIADAAGVSPETVQGHC
jgi:AcrR family transcriptional regulator